MAITFTANTTILTAAGTGTYRFNENTDGNLVFGTYTGLDQAATYSFDALGSHPNIASFFTLEPRTLQDGTKVIDLVSTANAVFDFETLSTLQASIRSSGSSSTTTLSLTLNLFNVNEAPTDLKIVPTGSSTQEDGVTVQETLSPNGAASAIVLGRLVSIDPDRTAGFGPNSARFTIDPTDPRADLYEVVADTENGGYLLRIKQGAIVDYDALPAGQKWHDLKIIIRDANGTGHSVPETIRINITNNSSDDPQPNTAPQISGTTAQVGVADNGGTVSPFGGVTITDDPTQTFTATVTLSGGAGTLNTQGVGTLTGNTYTVTGTLATVQSALRGLTFDPNDNANGSVGATSDTTFALSVSDGTLSGTANTVVRSTVANRAPTNVTFSNDTSAVTVQENGTANRAVGTLKGIDTNAGDTFTYTIVNGNGLFSISGNELRMVGTLDYEAGGYQTDTGGRYYVVQVQARDQGGNGANSPIVNLKVYVTDDTGDNNAPPSLAVNTTSFLSTGGAVNPFTGLVAADPNTADILTLTIRYTTTNGDLQNAIDRNQVTANTSVSGTDTIVTLRGTAAHLNEYLDLVSFDPIDTASTTTNFSFTIKDDQSGVQPIATPVTVTSTINGNAPPVITGVPATVQNVPDRGALVQPFDDIKISDTGELTVVVRMDTATKGSFANFRSTDTYNEAAGTLTIRGDADTVTSVLQALQFDPRDKAAGSVAEATTFTITVRDSQNAVTESQPFHVVATAPGAPPANRAPTELTLSNVTVQELAKNGDPIATLSAKDADNDRLTYKILLANGAAVDTDGYFTVNGNQLLVANGVNFDFEQAMGRQVTLQVSDGRGGTAQQTFTINISDRSPETMAASDASPFNDIIKGSKTGNFKDTFFGGAGDDKLWGGYGNDTLWGGTGKDTFVFDGKLGTSKTDRKVNFDTIKDYSVKDDSIWLENDLFKSNKALYNAIKKGTESKPLKMASKFFTVGDKAKQADDYFVYDSKKRVLYYDADGSGSKAAIELATFTNNKALKNFKVTELFFI